MWRHQNYLPSQNVMEVMTKLLEWRRFWRHLGFPQNANSTQPHGWFQCIPWSQKHTYRHRNFHRSQNTKEVMAETLEWQPSWTPSWISQNAQGWPKFTRQILKGYNLSYQYQLRKKLYKKFLGSSILLPD